MHKYLILTTDCTFEFSHALKYYFNSIAKEWFNYTPGAWLIITDEPEEDIYKELSKIFLVGSCWFIIRADLAVIKKGALPEQAWIWLRKFGFIPDTVLDE